MYKKKKEFLTLRASTFLVACSLGLNAYNYKTFTWGLLDTLNSKILVSNQSFGPFSRFYQQSPGSMVTCSRTSMDLVKYFL